MHVTGTANASSRDSLSLRNRPEIIVAPARAPDAGFPYNALVWLNFCRHLKDGEGYIHKYNVLQIV
jgi:hypothetical protein